MVDAVIAEVGSGVFVEPGSKGNKMCKGAKKKEKQKKKKEERSEGKEGGKESEGPSDSGEDGEEEGVGDEKKKNNKKGKGERVKACVDLNNRFGLLMIDDDS